MSAAAAATTATCQAVDLSDWRNLLAVIWDFLHLSLFSLGGGNTLLNEYHHMAVDQYCWLSSRQFADIYAIAEAAPGPSSMIVGLLGMGAAVKEGAVWALLSGVVRGGGDPAAIHAGDGGGRTELESFAQQPLARGLRAGAGPDHAGDSLRRWAEDSAHLRSRHPGLCRVVGGVCADAAHQDLTAVVYGGGGVDGGAGFG